MSKREVAVTRTPHEFEAQLRNYTYDRAEENRAVRIGEKEVSEQAAIIARYTDLFTNDQLAALRTAEDEETNTDERERLHRLRKTCESGLLVARLAPFQDALTNAEIAARVEFDGESLPLRAATAGLGTLSNYARREELGERTMDVSAGLNDQRLELVRAGEQLQAELSGEPDPVARSEGEKGISLRALVDVLIDASEETANDYAELRGRWLDRLLGSDRPPQPSSYHAPYVLRLSSLADVYTKDRATDVCLATLMDLGFDLAAEPNIRTDLDDRPQKSPRPSVIAADPPTIVYLITRPQGGLQDYQNFLHEAGHALHFAGCDPELPYTFRLLSRDYGLTEVYSYIIQGITCEPQWHARHFRLSADQATENAEAAGFLDAFMFRRFLAKLRFELDFWSRFARDGGTPTGYAENLTDATGFVYRADRYLADMDPGFYSADYLRAWIRSAQLRAYLREEVGEDWWRRSETGSFLRSLFREGTRPSNEELAERIGFSALDVRPLVAKLSV